MVTTEQLTGTLHQLLRNVAPDSQPELLKPTEPIMTTLLLDSYDFLQFIIAIDKQLKVNIPEEDYGKVMTLGDMITYLQGQVQDPSK